MTPRDRKFWGPWMVGMALAAVMILVGGFAPKFAGAQSAVKAPPASAPYIDVTKVPITIAVPPVLGKAPSAAPLAPGSTKAAAAAGSPVLMPTGAPASIPVVVATPAFSVSVLLDWLLKLAGIALATLIPLLLQRWLGGKMSADKLAAYSKLAADAVGHAEELAHQAVKGGAPRLDSNAKANAAVAYVLQAADALKLRPMAETAVKQMIDAKLGTGRTSAQ